MIFTIKRKRSFPEAVMIEPWAIDIVLAVNDELKLVIYGLKSESDVIFEHTNDDRLVIFSVDIDSVDVILNGVDLSNKYKFR
ncbi:MAG: hypothetical protein H7Z73_01865 [Candidatus Saccharibacteria bacterium]|nr:hypothetical protein [Moraxellaceae bacterium]